MLKVLNVELKYTALKQLLATALAISLGGLLLEYVPLGFKMCIRDRYQATLQDKKRYKKQILGSKDSFGKIFDITRKLDIVQPCLLYTSQAAGGASV